MADRDVIEASISQFVPALSHLVDGNLVTPTNFEAMTVNQRGGRQRVSENERRYRLILRLAWWPRLFWSAPES